jgi:hypothetical protein
MSIKLIISFYIPEATKIDPNCPTVVLNSNEINIPMAE